LADGASHEWDRLADGASHEWAAARCMRLRQ